MMWRAAAVMRSRKGELVDWLIRESGSTHVKAELEWQFVHSVTLAAGSLAHRVEGRILPLDESGKESRVYRVPLGVIGVISPWNFPMYLSQRSIAPALALGNAVVVKPAEDTPVTGALLPKSGSRLKATPPSTGLNKSASRAGCCTLLSRLVSAKAASVVG